MNLIIEYVLCYSGAYFLGVLSGIAGLWMVTYEKEVK